MLAALGPKFLAVPEAQVQAFSPPSLPGSTGGAPGAAGAPVPAAGGDGGGALRKSLHDPQTVHIRQRPVEYAQLPQVVGLVDDRGDCGADVRG